MTLLMMVLPAVVYGSLASLLFDPQPSRLKVRLQAIGRRCVALWHRLVPTRPAPPPDPFEMLAVQERLHAVAAQLRALEAEPRVWARGKRLEAAQGAYDGLLAEACRMAGVDMADAHISRGFTLSDPERFREELELTSHGWSW
ncbi:MAG TPA: hypothetical protein VGK35_02345 [Actinotalea sp.]|jgi:hypothetical protein